jgi:hypothetical protein
MSFFYDLNKKLDAIRQTPSKTHGQLNERDEGKPGKNFAKIAAGAAERYGSKEAGERVAGAVRNKLKSQGKLEEEGMSRAAKGYEKYGKKGMEALAKAGREGKALDPVRKKYDKYDESAGPAAAPAKSMVDKSTATTGRTPPYVPSKPTKTDNGMGRIVQGTWQADPKGKVPAPSGDPEGVKEAGMTPKQRSFAKLAPPVDKITFADKIAGAKKEVDEMLGDVAAEAMRSALGGGRGRNAEMDEDNAFDYKSPRKDAPRVGSIERGHKHDIKHTATGRMVTRRTDDQGISVGADDDSDTQAGPRGRGRPKGTKGAIGAKGPSGKSKLMTKEGEVDIRDQGEYDQEGDMAKDDIKTIVRHAQALSKVLGDNDNLPEWVQSKLAKIEGMMISIDEYMQNQASDDGEEEPIAEKAVSKKQQRFMGMVHAAQKGEKPASKEVGKVAKTMKKKDAEDFASTKHKGLPEKVKSKKKEEVDENSEEGRLITKQTGPGQTSTSSTTGRISATMDKGQVTVKPAKSGGMSFGKGIYDSMNRELELMIAESMSVNMSDSTEGNKSLTVTATDDDAMKLAMILKSAGLGGGEAHSHGEEACDTCGMTDCGCGDVQEAVDENAPDWPTNTEQADSNFGYAGGLNRPKTDIAGDGQSTVPVVATHPHNDDLRRIREMAGIKTEVDLGPTSPEVARMSKDEVNAALSLGMSPDVAAMSNDEVNAAFKSGMSPDTSDMNPDSVNAEFGKDDNQYEDSIQRMKEMAGIREAKKEVDEEKTEEGNLFTKGLEDDNVKIGDKIPGTNAIKKKDIDESIFALTNQWRAYKG